MMTDDSLISVIVPVYRVKDYINECIDSIINQTYRNLEIILVDDGSPDDCGEICDMYSEQDSRITVIHKQNGGLSDARNAGLDAAAGEYIAFVDGDDHIHHEMYERLLDSIRNSGSDVAVCAVDMVDENGLKLTSVNSEMPEFDFQMTGVEALNKLVFSRLWGYVTAWNKLYRAELFNGLRYKTGKIHEDEFIIHHIYNRCKKVTYIHDRLYYYVQRTGSIMNDVFTEKNLDKLEAFLDRAEMGYSMNYYEFAYRVLGAFVLEYIDASKRVNDEAKKRLKTYKKMYDEIYTKLMFKSCNGYSIVKRLRFLLFYISPSVFDHIWSALRIRSSASTKE